MPKKIKIKPTTIVDYGTLILGTDEDAERIAKREIQQRKYRLWNYWWKQTPEYKAYMKAYRQRPEVKARERIRLKARRQTPERKAYKKAYLQVKKGQACWLPRREDDVSRE